MDWSTCSPDIILLIFKYLDYKSLAICLSVCKSWRDIVDYYAGVKGIWPDLAQLAMYKKGIAFKQRSILPWRDLYFNYQLWNNRNIHLQLDTILELKQFKHMHVFEDNIFITFDSGMMQYKVDTLEGSLIEKNVLNYQQTHCITGKLDHKNSLCLKIGLRQKVFCVPCCDFTIINDHCLVTDASHIFSIIKCCCSIVPIDPSIRFKKAASLRLYNTLGTICSANIDNDIVYVVNKGGRIIRLKDMDFLGKTVGQIVFPRNNSPLVVCMFQKFSVIHNVSSKDGSKTMAVSFIDDTEEIVVECSGMTCVTPYGDILLLGYEDGEVRAYLQEKLLSTKEPLFTFNIKDLILDGFLDVAIKAIEVYEAKESHYLFIATQHQTIKVIVTYND
ncbi:PREDICTED: uncharacterized protein LOC106125506 [Papilio xuthus]|uniref:Uncharacterized protein LOC106125506 n=1 Tax=Papilio xuthus TaxID=66420 RepID=A0AAJ6ZSE3_PAPXU|nr:PREDICTED: uncharacterized protein LOC106125506 [Papilio xuthus]